MDNLNGLVVNIGKYFYGNKDVPFMQLLLRKQIRVNKNSCYYVFKAGEKFIGFVEVENYDIDNAEKPVRLFACDEFKNSSLENSMISFVASDNPDMKIEILVESDNRSLASTLEGLGFSIGDTIKYYSFHEEDLLNRLPRCKVSPISKLSKQIYSQFEEKFWQKFGSDQDFKKYTAWAKNRFDVKTSYAFVEDGVVKGWVLCQKANSPECKMLSVVNLDASENFGDFLQDVLYTILKDFVSITIDIGEFDNDERQLLKFLSCKPIKIEYKYIKK